MQGMQRSRVGVKRHVYLDDDYTTAVLARSSLSNPPIALQGLHVAMGSGMRPVLHGCAEAVRPCH